MFTYIITWSRSFQYVGETGQKTNKSFNWHEACFKNSKQYAFRRILPNHFKKGVCKNVPYAGQIFEKLDSNGITTHGALDALIKSKEKQK